MELRILATGSHGNGYLLVHGDDMLLIDPGVDMQTIYRAVDYKLTALQGCLTGHFHNDHSKSAVQLAKQYVDMYMSKETAQALKLDVGYPNVTQICCGTDSAGSWLFSSFPVEHDAPGSLGFYIKHLDAPECILYLTDTGFCQFNPIKVTTALIECNYIDDILVANGIEEERKIRLSKYHMSLERVLSYLKKIDTSCLRDIILIHLSDANSDSTRIYNEIKRQTGCNVYIAEAGLNINLDAVPF